MAAKGFPIPSPYLGPELVAPVREPVAANKETGPVAATGSEIARRALGLLESIDFEVTAIDFEVASAQCLYAVWQSQRQGDVYLIRTLERISEHMKALHGIQAALAESSDEFRNARSRPTDQHSPS